MAVPVSIYFSDCPPDFFIPAKPTPENILVFIIGGVVTYTINDQIVRLKANNILYFPKGTIREGKKEQRISHQVYTVHFHIEPDDPPLPLLRENKFRVLTPSNIAYVKQRFSIITQNWLKKQKYYQTICRSILMELLAIISADIDDIKHSHSKQHLLVLQVEEYILKNYRQRIEMNDLVQIVDRTPNYISGIFKSVTGQTITEYIQQIRVSAACDLIINSQMTIAEIAEYLGFSETSYFNRVFKKVTGYAPTAHAQGRWEPDESE